MEDNWLVYFHYGWVHTGYIWKGSSQGIINCKYKSGCINNHSVAASWLSWFWPSGTIKNKLIEILCSYFEKVSKPLSWKCDWIWFRSGLVFFGLFPSIIFLSVCSLMAVLCICPSNMALMQLFVFFLFFYEWMNWFPPTTPNKPEFKIL